MSDANLAGPGDLDTQARFADGDRDALAALVEKYHRQLFGFLLRTVGNPTDAEDLVQETWHRIRLRCDRYDPTRPFLPWLLSVARRLVLDEWRRHRLRSGLQPLVPAEEGGEEAWLVAQGPGPLDELVLQEMLERLRGGLDRLSTNHRLVFSLRYEQGLGGEEIAEVLGCPLPTVYRWLHEARTKLRGWLPDLLNV